jgi:predicted nucleic acid-binding protein
MKIFVDANVIVSVLNNEQPLFRYTSRILSLPDYNTKYKLYTSPICLAIAYYFAEKKAGNVRALQKIKLLSQKINICTVSEKEVIETANNPKILDFEDGLQYYSAKNADCDLIITENVPDFYFSKIKVLDSEDFLVNHFSL